MNEGKRVCKKCHEEKPLEGFATYTRNGEKLPLRTCKPCHREQERERQRRYIAKNRGAHNKRSRDNKRKRYKADPEYRDKLCAESREYYEEHKAEVLEKRMERYHEPFQGRGLESRDSFRTYEDEFEEALAEVRGSR